MAVLQLSTSRFMKEELSWIPLASWLEHNFRMETFGANSEDVPSGSSYDKLRGRFELRVVKLKRRRKEFRDTTNNLPESV